MTRKPRRRLLKPRPQTFSPFSYTLARLSSALMVKRARSKLADRNCLPSNSEGNGSKKQVLREKIEASESSSEDESELEGIVQADFAFFDPKADDFHGVKILLQTYLDDKEWDLSGFVDLILEQTTVGTVVKLEDVEDEGLFSIVTVLNLERYKDHKCISEIKEFLLKVCPASSARDNMKILLGEQAQHAGLLVSQRVVNLPLELLPPLYDALFDEVSWATEDEPTKELRSSFCFKSYLLVSRVYQLKNTNNQKRSSRKSDDEPVIYIKPEDELFVKLSSWSFTFPLSTKQLVPHELKNYKIMGLVMAVEAEKVSAFRQELKSLIADS